MMANYELDELDRELFKLLQANARMPTADIARALGVSRATATRRLDELDKKILDCLYDDVRISNRRVAAALDITEGTVRARIARMQKEAMVRFTATLDAKALYQPVSGIIGSNVIGDTIESVSRALAVLSEINFIGKMLGRYDIFCTFVVHNNEELAQLLQSIIPSINGVKSTESLPVVQVFKFDRRWSVLGLNEEQRS